jgi:hypothetical protein
LDFKDIGKIGEHLSNKLENIYRVAIATLRCGELCQNIG